MDWGWSCNSNTLATSCEELTYWKRPWCWEGLGTGGEGDNRGWDGWMASQTRWTWVWVNSRSWWWTRRPGVLQFMGSQRIGHDWATELNWILSFNNSFHDLVDGSRTSENKLFMEKICKFKVHKFIKYISLNKVELMDPEFEFDFYPWNQHQCSFLM